MISVWTNQEISSVLLQLEQRNLPFPGYTFCRDGDQCKLLGSGSFAMVFDAADKKGRNNYCIKVGGFGDKHTDPKEFRQSMSAQKLMSLQCSHIVKIHGYIQLYVQLDENNRVVSAEPVRDDEEEKQDCLLLQFAVMEKLVPVLSADRNRRLVLSPRELAEDDREIMRLAEHMVNALTFLHNNKILHRDIKLENIFYDPRSRRYKLGDFGIAKATWDGLANTVAFTKGYGAPEIVGMLDDRYDATADIYSLGMVLFVLFNDLRFPASDRYRVNPAVQYCSGYVLPNPAYGSEDVAQLLRAMCAYDPDDRPQSVKEVSTALDRLGFSPSMRKRVEEGKTVMLLGAVILVFGAGIYLLGANYLECRAFLDTVPWLPPLLLLQGLVFLCQGIASVNKRMISPLVRQWYIKLLWAAIVTIYGGIILVAKLPIQSADGVLGFFIGTVPRVARQLQCDKVGLFGLLICGLWWLRDRIRMGKVDQKKPPEN